MANLCGCRIRQSMWRVVYGPLVYHVCTPCLDMRLDVADEFEPFEPDQIAFCVLPPLEEEEEPCRPMLIQDLHP